MTEAPARVQIWDWPTRIFHWAIVLLIPVLWWTAEEDMMDRHMLAGKVMLGLLLFRILWGFLGSSAARFSSFVRGPRAVMSYLNGRAVHVLGHNPLGGWSVVAMLSLLSAQVGLGLFASDEDGLESGPLAHWIDYETAEEVAEIHATLFNAILVLIGFHIAAILFYAAVRRSDLVTPMLVGTRAAPRATPQMSPAPLWRFLLAAAIAASLTVWIGSGA